MFNYEFKLYSCFKVCCTKKWCADPYIKITECEMSDDCHIVFKSDPRLLERIIFYISIIKKNFFLEESKKIE